MPSLVSAQLVRREMVEPGAGLVIATDTTGSNDTYVACPTPAVTAYPTSTANSPLLVIFTPNTSNTGSATLNLCSLGAVTILTYDGGTLANNALVADRQHLLLHNGTNFIHYTSGAAGGGAGLSGLIDDCVLKADGTTNAECSALSDDGAGNVSLGVTTGNHHKFVPDTATGVHIHKLPAMSGSINYNKSIQFVIGDRITGSALADTADYPMVWRNNIGPLTIVEVWCQSDAGSPIINLQRDDGSAANILSSNLTCTTGGATATGTISGTEDNLAVGDKIGFVMVTAGGVVKEVTVQIKATVD